MGTRSLVHFVDDDETICTIYRQYDGYFNGRGFELADFLSDMIVVNGFSSKSNMKGGTHANGMGCLAAQWVAREKGEELGHVYLQPPQDAADNDIFIEYEYWVSLVDDELWLKAQGYYGQFEGHPRDFRDWVKEISKESSYA